MANAGSPLVMANARSPGFNDRYRLPYVEGSLFSIRPALLSLSPVEILAFSPYGHTP